MALAVALDAWVLQPFGTSPSVQLVCYLVMIPLAIIRSSAASACWVLHVSGNLTIATHRKPHLLSVTAAAPGLRLALLSACAASAGPREEVKEIAALIS